MVSRPQLQRDLVEIENHLRLTRNRLTCYDLLADVELAAHTQRVVEGLEGTRLLITARIQGITNAKSG